MYIREKKEVTEFKKVTVGCRCDNCGKDVRGKDIPDDWHHFSSHHNDWGNDSIDSFEYYDVCSPECYIEKFIDVVDNEMEGYRDGKVDDMELDFARNLSDHFKRLTVI